MNRFTRINRDFVSFIRMCWFLELGGALLLTFVTLALNGFFTGYFIQQPENFLDQVEFSDSSWFEIVSETTADGRFALCNESFILYGMGEGIEANAIDGGNAECQEYGISAMLRPGRWQFVSDSGATPTAHIWSTDLTVQREMPLDAKVSIPVKMFVMTLALFLATAYVVRAIEVW